MDDITKMIKIGEYLKILKDHGFFDNTEATINYVNRTFDTMPAMMKHMEFEKPDKSKLDETFDAMRYFTNLILFCDAVQPIVNKYNPADEVKNKLAEFIKLHPLPENEIDQMCQDVMDDTDD